MKKKDLVIVESPTKAKTVGKILGNNFVVVSSMGHLVDLPKKSLGVKVDANFEASYTVIQGRKKIIDKIKKEAKNKGIIYVATDPDREGEAIGWQIKNKILKGKNVLRVVFHEITSSAVKESFAKSRDFDENMVEAQAGRRILDRIVGYFLSPLLWRKLARGLSAGRVQSVALRLIVEREREIQKFLAKEYWEIEAKLKKPGTEDETAFMAKLDKFQSKKVEINSQEEAANIVALIKGNEFKVEEIKRSEKRR
ncbi:MAG: DNA topoisomerase I, partial [Candidatus Omnitrophica bacterium]|nr:DNA topoisomerase I [Candidatus Omnitrophota bacterium]